MQSNVIITLTGADRIGIVEDVTRLLVDRGGNIEVSHMAHLASEFAILLLVSIPSEQLGGLEMDMQTLIAQGYKVTTTQTKQTTAQAHADWLLYQIVVRGADQEGIVNEIAGTMRQRGINIESMDMQVVQAPFSGTPLFNMTGLIAVPPNLAGQPWEAELLSVGNRLNVDITVTAV